MPRFTPALEYCCSVSVRLLVVATSTDVWCQRTQEVVLFLFLYLVMVAFVLEKWNEIVRLPMEQPSS